MKKIIYLKIVLVFILLIPLEILFLTITTTHGIKKNGMQARLNKTELDDESQKTFVFRMTGIKSTNSKQGRIVSKLTADEIRINPQKFIIFNIRPFNELSIINATLELFSYTGDDDNNMVINFDKFFPLNTNHGELLPNNKNKNDSAIIFQNAANQFGVVSRGMIKNLTIKIFKDNHLSSLINAPEADIDLKNNLIKLRNSTWNDLLMKKTIKSKKMIIDFKSISILVPGHYVVMDGSGIKGGIGDVHWNID